ncbi:MAG: winged helix-turn-helix transcriptional regulator, partial [Proteobacteria bacterium]|nr:winged helix-turn-helix transcriptional regulator [Pseudomonadota bacterium]
MLSSNDRRILAELQRDSRLTMQELADKVGMSSSAVWRRVKSLEAAKIIDRYAVIVNPKKAGFGFASMVRV